MKNSIPFVALFLSTIGALAWAQNPAPSAGARGAAPTGASPAAAPVATPAAGAPTAAAPAAPAPAAGGRGGRGQAIPPVTGVGGPLEAGFTALFDGKTFDGWKMATENQSSWKIEDGAIVAQGNRSHLYYVGDGVPFRNFNLRMEVMTQPGSNGGIYFHTKYQETGWPAGGFENQVNNTHTDWKKTASLYDVANVAQSAAEDGKWWTQEIVVQGSRVTVLIDGKRVLEYVEPPGVTPGTTFERKIGEGFFALQAHDPQSVVRYRNIRVRRL